MGAKISVDSATLMNKGLEIVEAMWLFDLRPDQIDVVIHPQSIIHSLVEFTDGNILAHMGVHGYEIPHPVRTYLPGTGRITHGTAQSGQVEGPDL